MQNILMVAALAGSLTTVASAQYSQPVKEVEKEARTAVAYRCALSWPSNHLGVKTCNVTPAVPAGKILAVRNVSLRCSSRSSDFIEAFFSSTASVQNGQFLPLQVQQQSGGHVAGNASSFLHASAGAMVRFSAIRQDSGPGVDYGGQCEAHIQGFFIDE